jgi:hypothetical protein
LRCIQCGFVGRIFDARINGYDGVLNGGCTYESGDEDKAFVVGKFKVRISFGYSDFDELKELAEEVGVHPPDLFGSVSISGVDVEGREEFYISYECA